MSLETIKSVCEYWADEDKPVIDGDWIHNVLVLGKHSKNSADSTAYGAGTSKVKRSYDRICTVSEEYQKLDNRPSFILHKPQGHPEQDLLGTFHNPAPCDKGIRMSFLCKKVGESYHPQVIALRDNIQHGRPFGGFSPLFDELQYDLTTGEVLTIGVVDSIDLVPNPATVKSAVEAEHTDQAEDDERYVKKEDLVKLLSDHAALRNEHESLRTAHKALEATCHERFEALKQEGKSDASAAKIAKAEESVKEVSHGIRTQTIPEVRKVTPVKDNPFIIKAVP